MKLIFLFLLAATLCLGCNTQNQSTPSGIDSTAVKTDTTAVIHETLPFKADVPNADMQIKLAVLAAPPEKRDNCTVYGFDADNQLAIIRKGSNELICLADDPTDTSF